MIYTKEDVRIKELSNIFMNLDEVNKDYALSILSTLRFAQNNQSDVGEVNSEETDFE